jgi:O-acetyl-ADP-ribose deacetylase (regulator of RNase III)
MEEALKLANSPRFTVTVADITKLDFRPDSIANAANEQLAAGGEVCGAIHKAAGRCSNQSQRVYTAIAQPGKPLPPQPSIPMSTT